MGERLLMTRTTAVILLLVGIIFAIGINNVYGETYNDTISIPIPDNVTGIEKKATLTELTDHILEFTIVYRFQTADSFIEWREEILLDGESYEIPDVTICPDRFELIENTCYPIIILEEEPAIKQTKYEILLEELLKMKNDEGYNWMPKDVEFLAMLEQVTKCQRGLNQAKGIQELSSFVTSGIQMDNKDYSPVNIERNQVHSTLALAVQECIAQVQHLLPALGDYRDEGDVRSRQGWFGELQVYHSSLADKVPEWSQTRVMEESEGNKDYTPMTPKDILCNSEIVSKNYKRDQGCTSEQINPPCKTICEANGLGQQKNDNTPLRDNTAWMKFQHYLAYGDREQAQQIAKEALSKHVNQVTGYNTGLGLR